MDPANGCGVSDVSSKWHFFGKRMPKSEIVFFVQVTLIYVIVITSVVNITMGNDDGKMWTALLSSSLGYLLPNPSLKRSYKS